MRIVFMGTPEFAVPCLQAVIDRGDEVAAVYTQPDKPRGRGHKVLPPPVKVLAEQYGLSVRQPTTLRTAEAAEELRALAPDLIVVVAYGKILPKEILDIPPKGCVNVHASLLPQYRGAGPIQWCVLNGETKTGVTTMYMAEGLDTGDMIEATQTPIGEDETADELHDRLSVLGASLLTHTLGLIEAGCAPRTPQPEESSYAPMLDKSLSGIDFSKDAASVHHQICGLSSWPCAQSMLEGKRLKVYRSHCHPTRHGKPGEVLDEKRLIVACKTGAVELLEVQLEGSKRMKAADFLRGHPVKQGTVLGE